MTTHLDRMARTPPPARRREATVVTEDGEILTAVEVEQAITRISNAMERDTLQLARLAEAASKAEVAYKVKFAQERIKARMQPGSGPKGRTTNDEADDMATVACADELAARLAAEAVHGSAVERMRTYRSQLDALRTLAANIRAQT